MRFAVLTCYGQKPWIPCFMKLAPKHWRKRKKYVNRHQKAQRTLNKFGV